MDFPPEQDRALKDLGRWLDEPFRQEDQVRYLAGYAGTGKTTLAKYLAQHVSGRVVFAAFTGKAAYVMRSKGCTNATTIHSLIYKPAGESKSDALREIEAKLLMMPPDHPDRPFYEKERDRLLGTEKRKPLFTLNMNSDLRGAQALILDECSMIDDIIGSDLESFGVKILALGDPAQLPPVAAGGRYTRRKPDHLLTQVHRQARESGILRMATDVRETGDFSRVPGYYGEDCVVLPRGTDAILQRVLDADQLLVGRNATRHTWNARYRELKKFTNELPEAGDKVVCLRNEHEAGLLNGSLWRVHESIPMRDIMTVEMVISSEEDSGSGIAVVAHAHHFMGMEEELRKMSWGRRDAQEFDYGYALTVHKAQGSQWEDVVLYDESWAFRSDAQRWLYTGVTRAAKQLTVIV